MRTSCGFTWIITPEPSETLNQIVELFRRNQQIRVDLREDFRQVGLIIHGIPHWLLTFARLYILQHSHIDYFSPTKSF